MKAACSILLNRCVYFIGGCEINKFVMKSSKGVRVLNLKEKKPDWANAESMNEERCFMGAAVLRGESRKKLKVIINRTSISILYSKLSTQRNARQGRY